MLADRELLELAARAAGIEIEPCTCSNPRRPFKLKRKGLGGGGHWNPLEIDGDALRLAVNLNLDIRFVCEPDGAEVHCFGTYDDYPDDCDLPRELLERGPYVATRRAIVRAAAALAQETQSDE